MKRRSYQTLGVDMETSTKSKHTPGPWTYHHEPSLNRYAVRAEPFGTETILSISYWSRTPIWDRERAEADASRIVSCVNSCDGINPEAVPELLKAAENAIGMMQMAWKQYGVGGMFECMDALRSSVAKARGS